VALAAEDTATARVLVRALASLIEPSPLPGAMAEAVLSLDEARKRRG
jgi:hypothetical protein